MSKERVQFTPDLERVFQDYQRSERSRRTGTGGDNLIVVLLGDPDYAKRFKMPGWNIPVNMLQEPKVALRHANALGIPTSKAAHAQRVASFEDLGRALVDANQALSELARNTYGVTGPWISGSGQSHYPEDIKDRLRFLNHGLPIVGDAIRLHERLAKTRSPQFR